MNKTEIDILIGVVSSLLSFAETIDANVAQSKLVSDLNDAIAALKALGL
jgi:hypothetical protein